MKPSSASASSKTKKVALKPGATRAFVDKSKSQADPYGRVAPAKRRNKSARGAHPEPGITIFVSATGVQAHDAVMRGVSGNTLTGIYKSARGGLSVEDVLKAVGVSPRTAQRIKAAPDKPLDARTTDGIYRLESVRALAREVLGSAQAADEWLNEEAMGLEFRKPIDLLSTSPGAEAVKTLLQRMKYGVYA